MIFSFVPSFARLLSSQSPRVFKGAKQDGPTLQAVFYFSLREETARALENLDTAESGVRLLAEYFGWVIMHSTSTTR